MLRPTQRIEVVDKISRKLQNSYSFSQIDVFLRAYGIISPDDAPINSKRLYVSASIGLESDETLYNIAEELEIEGDYKKPAGIGKPRNWENTKQFKLFISHLSKDKEKATRLRECLLKYEINAFVAHEDIHPTFEWQSEIERALNSMDAFLSIHIENYSKSYWSQQEIGFAYCRGVKIISLRMGEDPLGFISKHQALNRGSKNAEIVAEEIFALLNDDARTKGKLPKTAKPRFILDDDIPF